MSDDILNKKVNNLIRQSIDDYDRLQSRLDLKKREMRILEEQRANLQAEINLGRSWQKDRDRFLEMLSDNYSRFYDTGQKLSSLTDPNGSYTFDFAKDNIPEEELLNLVFDGISDMADYVISKKGSVSKSAPEDAIAYRRTQEESRRERMVKELEDRYLRVRKNVVSVNMETVLKDLKLPDGRTFWEVALDEVKRRMAHNQVLIDDIREFSNEDEGGMLE